MCNKIPRRTIRSRIGNSMLPASRLIDLLMGGRTRMPVAAGKGR